MRVPDWYTLLLLALAVFRVWRLLAEDTILERPRRWLLGLNGWTEGSPPPDGYRDWLNTWLVCPWCCGAWLSLAAWGAWQAWPKATLAVCALAAISAVVGLVAHNLDRD